ncbi:MAG TPA: glycosyltransferase family 39 protein [Vicinamibacterales bacterium]|nr:glycosyltransferase family 39 protein [Vicinamibacterales bacterium]
MGIESRRSILIALLALSVAPYFVNLGVSAIWDANEAFYVQTPREMLERGDLVLPTFNYEPRLNKPVLSYWIVAAFYTVFGVSPGVQRLPIAIGGLVLIGVALLLARAGWPGPRTQALDAGLWAALGLAVSPRLLLFARRIFIDIYISMFMALTLLFFALAERHPQRRRTFLGLMYVAIGLATLTKGPMAIALPGLVFLLYLTLFRELRRVRDLMIPTGMLIVAAIVLPWYYALYLRDGWTPIVSFLLGENLARFADGVGVNASRGPLFYIPVVFSDALPWSVFLPAAAAWWFADRRQATLGPDGRVRALLWLWILVIVGFFSLSEAKQDLYIFPIVPAVAALASIALVRGASALPARPASFVRWGAVLTAALLLILGAGVLFVFRGSGSDPSIPPPSAAAVHLDGVLPVGAVALCGGIAALAAALRHRLLAASLLVAATLAAANWLIVLRVLPGFEVYKPVPALARDLAGRAAAADGIATYNIAVPSLVYYLGRRVEMAYDPAPIVGLLESDRRVFVIVQNEDYAILRSSSRVTTCVLSTYPTFDLKLRDVLADEPLPRLLLITNRCEPQGTRAPGDASGTQR